MKLGFKDPARIKEQHPKDKPVDGKNSPWDFTCPQYDQRHSCYVNAGTYYGEGINQPIGTFKEGADNVIPMGRVDTMSFDQEGY